MVKSVWGSGWEPDWTGGVERFLEFNIKRNSLVHVPTVELKIEIAISCLLKILIPLSRFSRFDKTDLKDFGTRFIFVF